MRRDDLDSKDRQILALLEADGRKSTSEIARLTHLSAPTVAERIGRLRDIGVIRGFGVKIDASKVGLPVSAVVEFQPRVSHDEDAISAVIKHPAVRTAYRVTGSSFLVLLVRVPTSAALQDMLAEFIRHGETRTSLILVTDVEDRPLFADSLPNTQG
ncbi:MAG TPA: Lrp/AsnC family transcriptional regulator [Sphingomicrobium sp.]|nr:Lrp/AsnC family transcriptional regulator [Sphingomicrobium sp.]